MVEELVSWEAARLLKEKGFDIPTSYVYNEEGRVGRSFGDYDWNHSEVRSVSYASAPSQSLVQKWIREKHNLFVHSFCNASGWVWQIDKCDGTFIKWSDNAGWKWDTYEEALECGIIEALKLIKQTQIKICQ